MFSGRLGRFSATAANPSLIAVSCPSSSRYHRTRSRNLTRLPTPLAVSLHRTVGGPVCSIVASPSLPPFGFASPWGRRDATVAGVGQPPCRRARHAGLRNAPPPDSRLLARHDCACVRPTLNRGAVEVLTEGSNYRGRRITNVGRKPSVDRTLLLGRAELARARPRTRPRTISCLISAPPMAERLILKLPCLSVRLLGTGRLSWFNRGHYQESSEHGTKHMVSTT